MGRGQGQFLKESAQATAQGRRGQPSTPGSFFREEREVFIQGTRKSRILAKSCFIEERRSVFLRGTLLYMMVRASHQAAGSVAGPAARPWAVVRNHTFSNGFRTIRRGRVCATRPREHVGSVASAHTDPGPRSRAGRGGFIQMRCGGNSGVPRGALHEMMDPSISSVCGKIGMGNQ